MGLRSAFSQAIERQEEKDHAFVIVNHADHRHGIARCHYELIGGRLLPVHESKGSVTVTAFEVGSCRWSG